MGRAKEWVVQQKILLQRIGAVALALALWQLLAMAVGQQLLVPTPLSVVQRLGTIWQEDGFWSTIWFTFRKIVAGFLLGLGFGLGFGALAGRFPLFEILFRPWAVMIKSIPVASFIILVLIWVPSRNLSVVISFLMVTPIVYSNVLGGVSSMDKKLTEMADVFQVPFPRRLRYLYLPQVASFFRSACAVGLGLCWKAGVAAEVIGLPDGSIGEQLYQAKVYLNTPDLFAWTLVIVLVSLVFERVFLFLLDRLTARLEQG